MQKFCSKCKELVDLGSFNKDLSKKDGLRPDCKCCQRKAAKISRNDQENLNHKRVYQKMYDKRRFANQDFKQKRKLKYSTNINYRLQNILRARLLVALKKNQKAGSAIKDLGCSIDFLKQYLEDRFYSNPKTGETMSWENYGLYGWHIDHIIPIASFNLTNREHFVKACHYTNLQPLWAEENLSKSSKINFIRRI